MQYITNDELKDAICNNDLVFLSQNINKYSINHRFLDEDNDTLLSYAISDPNSEVYTFFMDKNANTDLVSDDGENILHSAIYSGKLERVKRVINEKNINGRSKDGTTPLILSLGLVYEGIAHFLINSGANINYADLEGNLPIHIASFFGMKSIVLKLIEKGVSLNFKTKKGHLPLALAVNENQVDVIKILYNKMGF